MIIIMMIIVITIITGQPATVAEHIHGVDVIGYDLTVLRVKKLWWGPYRQFAAGGTRY